MPLVHLAPLAALVGVGACPAQRQDDQLWLQVNTHVPIADHVRVTVEQIARTSDRSKELYRTEFGALLGLRIAEEVEFGVGYR